MTNLRAGRLTSALTAGLVLVQGIEPLPVVGKAWRMGWNLVAGLGRRPVRGFVHQRPVLMRPGNPYPVNVRRYSDYNRPLVDLVRATSTRLGRAVTVIDVGAAIGDTALLLLERAGDDIRAIVCMDADEETLAMLRANVAHDRRVSVRAAMLGGSGDEAAPALVTTHPGTASPQGHVTVPCRSLDQVIGDLAGVDVLKIDLDGYDGRVLTGARQILARHRPAVLFEWDPYLCDRTRNPVRLSFDVLRTAGYRDLVFYDKTGVFRARGDLEDSALIDELESWCRALPIALDPHFDVVGFPAEEIPCCDDLVALSRARDDAA